MGKKFSRLLEGAMHAGAQEINGDAFEHRRLIILVIYSYSFSKGCHAAAAAAVTVFRKV